ncbi:hypothetical protein LTR10_022000 [Elasticomyces elasticus]|uniref:Uncharacterized protein n=1 Tax=Exophiala sideris TaxID=1016849 RepID=A0ABR0IYW7_9EURO|nr:hypothetical protein LTR10_022000 [Elasticomyces elasticus]KAK5022920.1 hypothetical protein LTS07_009648 [Exophiala sideris]KAK5026401.1 hypothetical protein LTR13_010015 [Exophiala sideris]KAK5052336.1 hypothetical protein LTR69_009872 [Exophiala sideris]KAK5177363.1 hypothetical protein LTR44_010158 [Eurotiomycetes sp. CCFEE 6388]
MASLSGQQGAGSKDNPPGKSSSGEVTSQVKERYLKGAPEDKSGSESGSDKTSRDESSSEITRTSDPLKGLDSSSSDEGGDVDKPTANEYAGVGAEVTR